MRIGKFRLGLLAGLAVGFVAGSAAGREPYNQIEAGTRKVLSRARRRPEQALEPPPPAPHASDEPPRSSF